MDIKEIALRVAREMRNASDYTVLDLNCNAVAFATALLAEIQKQNEPVYQFRPECDNWIDCSAKFYESWRGEKRIVFTFQPSVEAIENRVAEACAVLSWHCFAEVCNTKGLNQHHHGEWLKSAKAIRSGEYRKYMKEGE